MTAQEFLELLLPTSGYVITATPNTGGKGWIHTCHNNIGSAVRHVNELTFTGKQAYYAMSTYKEKKVWNETRQKFETRTQTNTLSIRSFFLDLDVDPEDDVKFNSKADALAALIAFVKKIGMPRPMVIDSGGGIHAYWPFSHEVATSTWRPVAEIFKSICIAERFKADRSLTSDQARVLRCLGGYNFRRDHPVKLLGAARGTYDFGDLSDILVTYKNENNIDVNATRVPGPTIAGAPAQAEGFEDNLGATNDPLHFDRITFSCAQLGAQVATRGAGVGEKLWRAGLGIVKFCEPQTPAYKAISDGHVNYSQSATLIKISNWTTGPTACSHFHAENPVTCEGCPHWKNITSPAQLGRQVTEAAPAIVTVIDEDGTVQSIEIPKPPEGYSRRKGGGVIMKSEDNDSTGSYEVISPYDFYPIKILRQNGNDSQIDERSVWRAVLPRLGPVDLDMSQSLISDTRKLTAHLMAKGVHMTQDQGKASQLYMSAYLQTLAAQADREKLYDRMGWHDNHASFVLGERVIHRDGTNRPHIPSKAIRSVTKEGVVTGGTMDGWKEAIQFFNQPDYEGHRFFIYAALGAPLFHMNDTGNKGVLMTASGASGRGKTTCLKACASLWGKPESLLVNGNKDGTTINALYSILGTYHSLPFLWDDITERDPEEMRRFLLNVSQGMGKIRMNSSADLADKVVEWQTIVLSSANTDDISRIMSSGRDVDPHLMRLIGVEFSNIDPSTEAKIAADRMIRALHQNFGHAGPAMMKQVVLRYNEIANLYVANVAKVDRLLNSNNASAERYWSATVAAAYTAGQLAKSMGILDFPVETDLQWMIEHMVDQRKSISDSSATAKDILVEFMNNHVRDTLVLSAKASTLVDNVVQRPTNALLIRHDLDQGVIHIARTAIMDHCSEIKTSFSKIEKELEAAGIITHKNTQKVLGADTILAKGQTRCWRINARKLGGDLAVAPEPITDNVVAIGGRP